MISETVAEITKTCDFNGFYLAIIVLISVYLFIRIKNKF